MLNRNYKSDEQDVRHELPATMGDRIRENRARLGLTQEQLGDIVGVSKVAVSLWESGTTANIRLETFLKLCDTLDADAHYLIFGAGRGAGEFRWKNRSA